MSSTEEKNEEKVVMGVMDMQKDLIAKMHEIVVAKNYPLAVVVASLEYLKLNYVISPMFNSIIKGNVNETVKGIIKEVPNGAKQVFERKVN
jgi:hypothetical protein